MRRDRERKGEIEIVDKVLFAVSRASGAGAVNQVNTIRGTTSATG